MAISTEAKSTEAKSTEWRNQQAKSTGEINRGQKQQRAETTECTTAPPLIFILLQFEQIVFELVKAFL